MKEPQVLTYAETLPNTTPILSPAQTRWLLVGHTRRFFMFLAALGLLVFYITSRGPTRSRSIGAPPLTPSLPQSETTLLSFTLWRSGVVQSGDDVLQKLSKDPTLAAFLADDHLHGPLTKSLDDRYPHVPLSLSKSLDLGHHNVPQTKSLDHEYNNHNLDVYRPTMVDGSASNILRVLGTRTVSGLSRSKAADSGRRIRLLGWSADAGPRHALTRTKDINNFKETYRISA